MCRVQQTSVALLMRGLCRAGNAAELTTSWKNGKAMTTHAKHPLEAVQVGAAPAIEFANEPTDTQMPAPHTRHVVPSSYCSIYRGYGLSAHARPANTDLYAADLLIERSGSSPSHFRALDYFYSAAEALRYATRWGRIWVDHRLRKVVERSMATDDTERRPDAARGTRE